MTQAQAAFLNACRLDVAVRKPGNVSLHAPGHRMTADLFVASAEAAAGPLCHIGARVGARIEAAVAATWRAVNCNTNLGILLLCAPLAAAAEKVAARPAPAALQAALRAVLERLDVVDAAAGFRAIAMAQPAGLGRVDSEDVHTAPTQTLRQAMVLAADRDSVARQYRDGYADLFGRGLQALGNIEGAEADAAAVTAAVQRLYLALLAAFPDSHIARKHGAAAAQQVMAEAAAWSARASAGETLDGSPAFVAWDDDLKRRNLNPGTSADLTVATLMIAGLIGKPQRPGSAGTGGR